MLKTLLAQIKEYKKDTILTPVLVVVEVILEVVIPLLMAMIIDKGIEALNKKATYIVDSISDCLKIIDKK